MASNVTLSHTHAFDCSLTILFFMLTGRGLGLVPICLLNETFEDCRVGFLTDHSSFLNEQHQSIKAVNLTC